VVRVAGDDQRHVAEREHVNVPELLVEPHVSVDVPKVHLLARRLGRTGRVTLLHQSFVAGILEALLAELGR